MEQSEEKENPRSFFKSFRNYFREYCNCTSIHGFRYFGEKRTYFERGWWMVIFLVTLSGCIFAIREVYLKWLRTPVIVSFATRETPIYQIPFPAVTICSEAKSQLHIYNHTRMMEKNFTGKSFTPEESKLIDYMSMLCERSLNYSDTETFSDDFYQELLEMAPELPLFDCKYNNETKCTELFRPIVTDEGICYTFNMQDQSEIFSDDVYFYKDFFKTERFTYENWSVDNGYSEMAGLHTYPHRAVLTGVDNALTILLMYSKDSIDQNCKTGPPGFRVTLHTPMRVPRPSQQYFMVPLDEVVLGTIKPDMITTSNSVKMYSPAKRECYFPQEKSLRYFKIYTALNCKLECLTNFTLNFCGCVDFFMPRDNNTSVCGTGNYQCMEEAQRILEIGDLETKLRNDENKKNKKKSKGSSRISDCDCLPMCNDLTYNVDVSQSPWNWDEQLKVYNFTYGKTKFHFSKLALFFQSSRFITSQRHELYGPTDFLANFGGLLGLFTGFSILSLMEIIYFLTVRLCCNNRLYGYWAGPENR